MATTQQLLDLKYDQQLGINQIQLQEIFSLGILGALRSRVPSIFQYSQIISITEYTHRLYDVSTIGTDSLKGINHCVNLTTLTAAWTGINKAEVSGLVNLTVLNLATCKLTAINVSQLVNLISLYVHENQLTTIGSVTKLLNLSILYARNNQLTTIGDISALVNLTDISLSYNSLTTIGAVTGLTKLTRLDIPNNLFSAATLLTILQQLEAMLTELAPANRKLTIINIGGAGMGVLTAPALTIKANLQNNLGVTTFTNN